MDDSLTLLLGGLGLTPETLAPHVVRTGSKERGVTRQRVEQLAHGTKDDQARVVSALYRAAKARGWSEARLFAATEALAPEHYGDLMLARLEDSNDPTAGYIRMLVRGRGG